MKCQFRFLYLLIGKKICKKCPWYVTLQSPIGEDKKAKDVNNCAIAWIPLLMTELRSSIDNITKLGMKIWKGKAEEKIEEDKK